MATVNKDFRLKHGLVVEGTTGTINGNDILTKSSTDQSWIINLIGGTQYITSVGNNLTVTDGELNVTGLVTSSDLSTTLSGYVTTSSLSTTLGDYVTSSSLTTTLSGYVTSSNLSTALGNLTTDDIGEGATNKYFTSERAVTANEGIWDTSGAAQGVQDNLDTHTGASSAHGVSGSIVGTTDTQSLSGKTLQGATYFQSSGGAGGSNNYLNVGNSNGTFTMRSGYALELIGSNDVTIKSDNADIILNADGNVYIGSVSSGNVATTRSTLDLLIGDNTVNGSTGNTIKDRIDSAVASLVDGAPDLLNTLNELAAAINDDAGFSSTITTAIGGKVAKAGDTMTGALVLSGAPTIDLHAATKKYVDDQTTATIAEDPSATGTSGTQYFTNSRAVSAIQAVVPQFTAVEINSVAKQVAATVSVSTAGKATAYSWAKASYRSAEFLVKVANGTHTEVSKVILTLDTSDNIAITEYAVVGTNGSLSTVSAEISGTNVLLTATTVNNSSTVTVTGTLLV